MEAVSGFMSRVITTQGEWERIKICYLHHMIIMFIAWFISIVIAHSRPFSSVVIARDFKAEQPNQKWLTDITEFHLPAGKVWLSPVVDCFDGKVVSWSLSTRPDAELVNTMLDSAVETLNASERPVIHSDRGGHYRWPGWLAGKSECSRSYSLNVP